MRSGNNTFMLMSTSVTTGLPKGVAVPLKALLAFYVYMRDAVDLRPRTNTGTSPIRAGPTASIMPWPGALFMGDADHILRWAVHGGI